MRPVVLLPILLACATRAASAGSIFASLEAGLLWPQSDLETAVHSGSAFALSAQAQANRNWALVLRAGYGQFVGNRNDKLRVALVPVDLAAKFGVPFESGFVPYAQAGLAYTGIFSFLGGGRDRGADPGLSVEVGTDLHADSGLGLGIGVGARTFVESGGSSTYWALFGALRISMRVRGRPIWTS